MVGMGQCAARFWKIIRCNCIKSSTFSNVEQTDLDIHQRKVDGPIENFKQKDNKESLDWCILMQPNAGTLTLHEPVSLAAIPNTVNLKRRSAISYDEVPKEVLELVERKAI